MTHQSAAAPPREDDHVGWLSALLTQRRGQLIPPEFLTALHHRLAHVPLVDLLAGLDPAAQSPDRGLTIQLYTAWIAACADPAQRASPPGSTSAPSRCGPATRPRRCTRTGRRCC